MIYLNVGAGKSIPERDIVGIFDMDTASVGKETKQFLSMMQKRGSVISELGDIPKSFVVMADGKIYLSQYAAKVLKRRTEITIR